MEFKVLVKVVLLLSLIGFTATTVDATLFDPSSFITRLLPNGEVDHSNQIHKGTVLW